MGGGKEAILSCPVESLIPAGSKFHIVFVAIAYVFVIICICICDCICFCKSVFVFVLLRFSMGDSDLVSKSGSSSSSSISELRLWEATTVLHTRTADLLQRADSDLAEPDLADPPDWRSSISAEQLAR